MGDNIYESFNHISFEEDEFNNIQHSLTEVEKKKVKKTVIKKVTKHKNKYLKIAASITITTIIGITVTMPAFAKEIIQYIPQLDGVYEKLGYYKEYKDFSEYVGVSKESQGYKFTIDKIVADDDTTMTALRISKPNLNADRNKAPNFFIIGELLDSKTNKVCEGIIGSGVNTEVIDENTSLVVFKSIPEPNKILPKRFNMRVNIHSIEDNNININIDLPVSREKTISKTIVKKNIGESTIKNKGKVKINEFNLSPLNTDIKYSFKGSFSDNEFLNFYIYDDKGRIYPTNLFKTPDNINFTNLDIEKIESEAKKVYIVPYIIEFDENDSNKNQQKNEEVDFYSKSCTIDTKKEFESKEYGKVNVYKTEKTENSIKIYYNFEDAKNTLNRTNIISLFESKDGKVIQNIYRCFSDIKLYRTDKNTLNNYYVEFNNIDVSKNYNYLINEGKAISKYIEGTPIEVDLK